MRQTYAARRTIRAGTEAHQGRSRNGKGESGVRLRMVPTPGGVAFVEDKPLVEGDRKVYQSNEIENRREHRDELVREIRCDPRENRT